MNVIERFALVQHHGPYEDWPAKTPVIIDGSVSSLAISGFNLLHQYETAAGYLLVTDFDCPFEEAVCFVLVSKDLATVLNERTVGQMYNSFWLDEVFWLDEAHFYATFHDYADYRFYFTIRPYGIPWIYPRLGLACRRFNAKSGKWRRDIR
ncbi:hypothetical protein HKK52_10010 [Pseudomonas sp. ADAK2]|uniref:hypothetical protein n=1 Tax=unclassified Pseudomonas TaxID=196821 RepID=UPI001462C8A6|nr:MULTISPECIES: hypothetical protein [unclassified Pseudomonas]QJI41231.1 hypothetical protein HKK53_10010 [Pseudomonas sp. ADAK7]QJI47535.1 hypothetical protein HKK52_10010 [Pseudomonas sp. ADAK2]